MQVKKTIGHRQSRQKIERVTFEGKTYYRYPDSPRRTLRVYFLPYGGGKRLHIAVWESHNGRRVPRGYHVHHKDENPLNNDPLNLEVVTPKEHARRHHAAMSERGRRMIGNAIAAAPSWHRSKEGRKWHKEHAFKTSNAREKKDYVCRHCCRPFKALPFGTVAFCRNACRTAFRKASGVDDVDRVCHCGAGFRVNKYSKAVSCSPRCRTILGHKKQENALP